MHSWQPGCHGGPHGGVRGRPARLALDPQVVDLVVRLARENPRWGYLRIVGKCRKLGVRLSATSVRRILRAPRRSPSTPTLRDATGLSVIHIRLYTDLIELEMPENQWDDLAVDGNGGMLHPDRLRHLYHGEQRPLRDIARRTLTTERVVRGELTAAGTTL